MGDLIFSHPDQNIRGKRERRLLKRRLSLGSFLQVPSRIVWPCVWAGHHGRRGCQSLVDSRGRRRERDQEQESSETHPQQPTSSPEAHILTFPQPLQTVAVAGDTGSRTWACATFLAEAYLSGSFLPLWSPLSQTQVFWVCGQQLWTVAAHLRVLQACPSAPGRTSRYSSPKCPHSL